MVANLPGGINAATNGPRFGPVASRWQPRVVAPPSGFGWSPTFAVIETAPGKFTANIQPTALRVPTNVTRYVAISDGNNADSGLSWALAHKSIWDCINAINDTTTVYIEGSADPHAPTMYDYDNAWRSALAFDANFIVVSDRTTLAPGYAVSSTYMPPGGADLGTWALTADPDGPHVYEATLAAAPNAVIDGTVRNAFGVATRLTSRASVALVEANPGSYYHAGGVLYVRTATAAAAGLSWALAGEPTPLVYEALLATEPFEVLDGSALAIQVSAADVNDNAGSYFWDAGTLYVRLADDRAPDSDVIAMISRAPDADLRALKASVINGHINTSTVDAYLQGLTFEGGNARCLYIQAATSVTLVDCTATHGQSEGISLTSSTASGDYTLHLIRCKALDCDADGLQYTTSGANAVCRVLEWNCESAGNSGAGTDQGSTAHFTAGNTSVSVIRVGGYYHGNKTQEIADVGGCDVWMLGSRIGDGAVVGFFCGDTSTAWLQGCILAGNSTDLQTDNAAGVISVADTCYATTTGDGTEGTVYHP